MGQQTPLEKKKRLAKRGIMSRLASPFCGLGWGLEEGREGLPFQIIPTNISVLLLVLLAPAFLLRSLWPLLRLPLGLRPRLLPHLALGLWSRLLPDLALRLWSWLLPYLGPRLAGRLLSHLPRGLRLDLPLARLDAGHLRPTTPITLGLPGSIFLLLSPLLLLLRLWLLLRRWSRRWSRRLHPDRGGRGGCW